MELTEGILRITSYCLMCTFATCSLWVMFIKPALGQRKLPKLDLTPGERIVIEGETLVIMDYSVYKHEIHFRCERLERVEKRHRAKREEAAQLKAEVADNG